MKPVCRTCGGKVLYGDLFCSKACGQAPKQAHEQLKAAGFEPDATAPNIYRKDGVAVTVEAVHHVGLAKTLRAHAHAAQGRG